MPSQHTALHMHPAWKLSTCPQSSPPALSPLRFAHFFVCRRHFIACSAAVDFAPTQLTRLQAIHNACTEPAALCTPQVTPYHLHFPTMPSSLGRPSRDSSPDSTAAATCVRFSVE